MIADIVAAVRQMLLDDIAISDLVDGRIFGVSLPREEEAHMPRKNIVIARGGSVPSVGSNSYIAVKRMRLDFTVYGEDGYEASVLATTLDVFMKAIQPQVVTLTDGSVRVLNAVESSGPIDMVDPDTDWPSVRVTWAVEYSEHVIAAEAVSS